MALWWAKVVLQVRLLTMFLKIQTVFFINSFSQLQDMFMQQQLTGLLDIHQSKTKCLCVNVVVDV